MRDRFANRGADVLSEDAEYAESLDMDTLESFVFDSVVEAADGCSVEPDGVCPHGHASPLYTLGLI